jgi:acyl-ACP thioesterase
VTPRRFAAERTVRLGDVTPSGRLRLDAVARYLQDVATDDATDAAVDGAGTAWVVRRTGIDVAEPARYLEGLRLTTWCTGAGSRWAERTTSIEGDRGARLTATAIWVHVDLTTGRPARLPESFHRIYGESAAGRQASHRLTHPAPPAGGGRRPWPLRRSDLDVLGHVNNAAYWEPVEDELARRPDVRRRGVRAELEYRGGIDAEDAVEVLTADGGDGLRLWLVVGDRVEGSAWVGPPPPG